MHAVRNFCLTKAVLTGTQQALRSFGVNGCEGFVLWVGHVDLDSARILHFIVPPQTPIKSEDGVGYFIDAETLFELNKQLSAHGLQMIAQVHSHPTEAYHSTTDDRYAIIAEEGGLSLVVPDFASGPASLEEWAIYRLVSGRWRRVPDGAIEKLFTISVG